MSRAKGAAPTGPPIFVIGAPRSGTTLLSQILSAHPSLTYAIEPRLVWRWGNDWRSDALEAAHARPRVRRHIQDYFSAHVAQGDGTRLLEKTPANALRVGFIDAIFPQALFIHITRDGRDAVPAIMNKWVTKAVGVSQPREIVRTKRRLTEASLVQYPFYASEWLGRATGDRNHARPWGPRLPGQREMRRHLTLVEICSWQWRACVERALLASEQLGERYMQVRLETLTAEDIRRIERFADLDVHPAVVAEFKHRYEPASVALRRNELGIEQYSKMMAIIAPTLTAAGYGDIVGRA